ncbi:hypothetical protein FQZ97_368050 [compost metagenome]
MRLVPGGIVPLPGRVVGVLDRQGRQGRCLALEMSHVESGELVEQQAQRPAVGDDMVQGHQQQVLLFVQAHQPDAQQRAVLQVEEEARLFLADRPRPFLALRFG